MLFALCASGSGLFAPCAEAATQTAQVTFLRATRAQNSAGELLTSFATYTTLPVALLPRNERFQRFVQGTWTPVQFDGIVAGYTPLQDGDRALLQPPFASPPSGVLVEVVDVRHYGVEQTELSLRFVR